MKKLIFAVLKRRLLQKKREIEAAGYIYIIFAVLLGNILIIALRKGGPLPFWILRYSTLTFARVRRADLRQYGRRLVSLILTVLTADRVRKLHLHQHANFYN